ncbi:hypothetical protein GG344DRAFT_84531 [Lentinula edodes]|nr:hypothetical protein GG344DRAFT_84531 [Lentinula edodes]
MCLYPFIGTTKASHRAEFHSRGHGFLFRGAVVRVNRRDDGMIPCPCGLEEHARYSFQKLNTLNKQIPHPGSDVSEWADLPSNKQAEIPPASPIPSPIPALLDERTAEEVPPHDTPQPPSPPSTSSIETQPSSAANPFGGEELSSPSNSLRSALGHLEDTDMVEEDSEKGTQAEPTVEEKEIVCSVDSGIIGEVKGDDELEDDEDELDEEDVPSEDEASLVQGDDMDLDIAPSSLSHPEILSSLSRFNVSVEPVYHLSICTECAIPVRLEHMYTHQKTKHFKGLTLPPELSFPSRAELESLLATLGADQPLEVPVGPIPRIQGVQIIQGLKCTTSECSGKVFGAVEGLRG